MRDVERLKAELRKLTTAEERDAFFRNLIGELDHEEELNDRKHCRSDRRSDFDISLLDSAEALETPILRQFRELCNSDNWDDIIFSQRLDDLTELTTDKELIEALSALTGKRKAALFYRGVWKYTPQEIAAYKGVSDRSVRKLYNEAIKEIHRKIREKD